MEAYQRIGAGGLDLSSAVHRANESIGLEDRTEEEAVTILESQASGPDNDKALADLQRMMGGAI